MLLAGIQLASGAYSQARQNYIRVLQQDPGYDSVVDGIRAAEKGAFEEILNAASAAFAAGDLPLIGDYLEQAAAIYPSSLSGFP